MTKEVLRDYCALYGRRILVRDEVGGKLQRVNFSELSKEKQEVWIGKWQREGRVPHIVTYQRGDK